MPPNRRLPPAEQPHRRPRVAGLRKPSSQSQDTAPAAPASAPAEETVAESLERINRESRPRRKARDTGTTKPDSADDVRDAPTKVKTKPRTKTEPAVADAEVAVDADVEAEVDADAEVYQVEESRKTGRLASGRNRSAWVAVFLVLTVIFAGLAVLFKIQQSSVAASTDNAALVDVAETARVKDAMMSASERLFSVDFNDLAKTETAAKELLVNDEVRAQHQQFMGNYQENAPKQKLVVTVQAIRSAVVLLEGDRARVMVYVMQTSVRASDNAESGGPATLWFDAKKVGDQWKIVDMNTYGTNEQAPAQPAESQGQQPPQQPGNK